MHDIFVSYSSNDRERVIPLINALKQEGFSVWWDPDLTIGEVFDSVIENALNNARCCLVVWSRQSVSSDWVRAEATKANERGILLPVLLEKVAVPAPFNILQAANFTAWSGALPFSEFNRLVASIRGILADESAGRRGQQPIPDDRMVASARTDFLVATDARSGPSRPGPIPPDRGREHVVRLADAIYPNGPARARQIQDAGQIVFHAIGDTGNVSATREQETVAHAMLNDFEDPHAANRPVFLLHLGDIVYNFGEEERYYDQFYYPYRNYPGPIFAIAGHHDGMVAPGGAPPLAGFLRHFCAAAAVHTPRAGDADRTAQTQPGVYFTVEAPFVRILAIYSNCLGGAGIISSQHGKYPELSDSQLDFLGRELSRIKKENYSGAVMIAVHHPPYCVAGRTVGRGDSREMLADLDSVCLATGVWPHAVLSAHSDNYQRFTRFSAARQMPYIIAGNGGHPLDRLSAKESIPTPVAYVSKNQPPQERVIFDRYDHDSYGYLRIAATATRLQIDYVRTSTEIFDSVTLELATRKIVPGELPLP